MKTDESLSELQSAYQQHLHRRQGLELCKQLIHLTIELQKHRGCTLAILSGDHFFETQLYGIQRDITDRLNAVEESRREFLSLDESMHIIQEWICIRRQWSNDTPEENFLLHSNLIAELLKLIRRVVKRTNLPIHSPERSAMISLCFDFWMTVIETTAQARGLATHCAVRTNSPAEISSRLNFLHRQLVDLNLQFSDSLATLSPASAKSIRDKAEQVRFEQHMDRFLLILKQEFCDQKYPSVDADTIYTAGSHVVSDCQQVLMTMLKIIENKPSPELESWIEGKTAQGEATLETDKKDSERYSPSNESRTAYAAK